jgi:BMFP domain-containing protein YqiC
MQLPEKARREGGVILGMKGSGKSYTGKSSIAEPCLEADERLAIVDPTGVWWGLRLQSDGAKAAFPVVIFGGDHADVQIHDKSGEAIAKLIVQRHFACVIDLSEFTIGAQTRFMTGFLDALYHGNRKPLTIIFDEADLFAPQRPLPEQTVMLHRMEQIFRRGRVRGFRPWSITQRPAELHKSVLSQAATLIAMKLMAPHDRKAVMEWIKGQPQLTDVDKVLASIPQLKTGEGWVWCPAQSILERGQFPQIKTFDSSRTPEEGDELATLPRLDNDVLADLAASLRAIEEGHAPKPKRSLPKEDKVTREEADQLRAENASLKSRLAALEAQQSKPPAPKPLPATSGDPDALYETLKARLLSDLPNEPILLRILVQRPELRVEVAHKTVTIDGASLKGRVARLIAQGFFDDGKTQGAARSELKRTGPDVNQGNLWRTIKDLVNDGFLTVEGSDYRAVAGMKVNIVDRSDA